jgi:uncharacterized membrane protein (UPF0127 family)
MRHQTRPPMPPPSRARRGLLAGGLVLVGAGVAVVAWVLAVSAGLVGGDDPAMDDTPRTLALEGAPTTTGGAPARTVDYRLEPAGGPATTVRLEVAADPATRARGLMGRTEVPEGTGMVFLYRADVTEAFWMKNTLVPLSIAFVAADGRVVSVAEMTPCKADPCPTYAPAGPYRYAVELAAGSFPAAGVGPGAKVAPVDPAALPEPA